MPHSLTPQPRRSRRGSAWGIIFLVILAALFVLARMGMNQNKRQAQATTAKAQSDPQSSLERFYVECGRELDFKNKEWQTLLEYCSQDDQAWLEENKLQLASMSQEFEGMLALAVNDSQRRYGSLQTLLRPGPLFVRPVVVRVHEMGAKAVAYVHPPNNASAMREVFMVKENDRWKVRRFLGSRDDVSIVSEIAEAKRFSNQPLSADEELYLKDPDNYATIKRTEYLGEVGLKP